MKQIIKKTIDLDCPLCHGQKHLQHTITFNVNMKGQIAKAMRKEGATLAQIAEEIKVKSVSTVQYYLDKEYE